MIAGFTQKEVDEDFNNLMRQKAFRNFLVRLLARTGAFASSFDPDIAIMARNEGNREIGMEVYLDAVRLQPALMNSALEEYRDKMKKADGKVDDDPYGSDSKSQTP